MESLATNVARLKTYRARLILFPRKAGKHKKEDSSKEDVEAARKAEHVKYTHQALPIATLDRGIKEIKKSEMPAPIEGGAYRKLREARSEARLVGKREKRAKDKADEAAAAKK